MIACQRLMIRKKPIQHQDMFATGITAVELEVFQLPLHFCQIMRYTVRAHIKLRTDTQYDIVHMTDPGYTEK